MVIAVEDSQIIALFSERSEEAIAALSHKYGALCFKVASNILNNDLDAEECVNDAYLGVWNTVPPQTPNPLVSYLCRIVRNLAIRKYHANRAAKRDSSYDVALEELENCFASSASVESEFDAKTTAQTIDRFLYTLDRDGRVMFVRRYYYGDSVSDLAELFGVSNHFVSVRLHRIRERLKKYLEKEGVFV